MSEVKVNGTYNLFGEEVVVKSILKPYQMGLGSKAHNLYLEGIQDFSEAEVQYAYNIDWVVFEDTEVGIRCMALEEFEDMIK